ncbi:hypothetical protein [Aquiflexum lacus]|uniref:hypothetical protein n=1 Tax=Aquiflexum lacus TaxID=2483805 RepID=UPI001894D8F3|nr:hypothetical protein [Aquiflexum lacus]
MTRIIYLTAIVLVFAGNSYGQTYVSFKENGLMHNANAFGALLCPLDKGKADGVLKKAVEYNLPKKTHKWLL